MSRECPTCGRDDFKSEKGLKQHHGRTHGESLSRVALECEWCGDEYTKLPSKATNSRFCSNDCKLDAFHEQRRGSGNMEQIECDFCGESLERYPNKVSENNFCDRDCKDLWMKGENHPQWKGGKVEVECCVCGAGKEVFKAQQRKSDRHFCSDDCHYQWVSENHRGEDHGNWKGGVSHEYPGSWSRQRRRALERDDYECRACGMSQEEHKQRYDGRGLEVHHVKPVRTFDDPADAHSLGNLVTACKTCHGKYEGLPVFPE